MSWENQEAFEEQSLWEEAMRQMLEGDTTGLVKLLRRGKPVSSEVADFVGAIISGIEFGGHSMRFVKLIKRGRPPGRSREKSKKAVFLAHYLIKNEGLEISEAAREAASKFHVDHDTVRKLFKTWSHLDLASWPGYAAAVAEAEADPG